MAVAATAAPATVAAAAEFEVVDERCATEALASFLADVLREHPQAFSLPPGELHAAVLKSVQETCDKRSLRSRMKRTCAAAYTAYRWWGVGQTALQTCSSPFAVHLALLISVVYRLKLFAPPFASACHRP
jgi:hypothetical protein